jgi:galactokinase
MPGTPNTTIQPQSAVPEAFRAVYGYAPTIVARAPGRINIIGEHTDYNGGFVLPAAIDKAVYIAAALRTDQTVNVHSLNYDSSSHFTLDELIALEPHDATLYPRGVLWLLRQMGHAIRGMDLTIGSDVPIGAGVSSSAAAGVAMIEVATHLFQVSMTQTEKAMGCVRIENEFVGVRTGAMDQLISALGLANYAMLIDCRNLDALPVPIPAGVGLLLLDTGKRRELTNTGYSTRRAQCETAAELLGVSLLRDVTPERFEAQQAILPEVNAKRARHVVYEDARTLEAVDAFREGKLQQVGELMNASHASLRDLYEVSCRELDIMAELAQREPGVFGARMMGGGFGGAVIALVNDSDAAAIGARVAVKYDAHPEIAPTTMRTTIFVCHAGAGSGVVSF